MNNPLKCFTRLSLRQKLAALVIAVILSILLTWLELHGK